MKSGFQVYLYSMRFVKFITHMVNTVGENKSNIVMRHNIADYDLIMKTLF
jgi:hypothetical protein